MATTSDWLEFEGSTGAQRPAEPDYFARLDAAEAYAAHIERLAEGAAEEPGEDWEGEGWVVKASALFADRTYRADCPACRPFIPTLSFWRGPRAA